MARKAHETFGPSEPLGSRHVPESNLRPMENFVQSARKIGFDPEEIAEMLERYRMQANEAEE